MRTLTPIDDQPTNTTALVFDYGERRVGAAYANRLSDWLFVAGRAANQNGKDDVKWVPGANR